MLAAQVGLGLLLAYSVLAHFRAPPPALELVGLDVLCGLVRAMALHLAVGVGVGMYAWLAVRVPVQPPPVVECALAVGVVCALVSVFVRWDSPCAPPSVVVSLQPRRVALHDRHQSQRPLVAHRVFGALLPLSPLLLLLPRGLNGGVRVRRGFSYLDGPGHHQCKLDVWTREHSPPSPSSPRPVCLYFHGGAWRRGSRLVNSEAAFLGKLAREGWVVVSASYRLAQHAPFPACVEDAVAVARWVWLHAGEFGGDRERLVVSGSSAGGQLAALLVGIASLPREEPPRPGIGVARHGNASDGDTAPAPATNPHVRELARLLPEGLRFRACVLFAPVLDPLDSLGLHATFPFTIPRVPFARRGTSLLAWFFRLAVIRSRFVDEHAEDLASVLNLLPKLSSFPPCCILHGTLDSTVPVETSREFLKRLAALDCQAQLGEGEDAMSQVESQTLLGEGSPHALLELPGARHSGGVFLTTQNARAHAMLGSWLHSVLCL